jgi:hypothetical protein
VVELALLSLGSGGRLSAFGSVAAFVLAPFARALMTIDSAFTTLMTLMLVPLSFQLVGAVYVRVRVLERQTR